MVLDYKKIEEFLQECKAEIDRLDAQYLELAKAADNMKPFYEKLGLNPDISALAQEAIERAEIEGCRRKDALIDKLGIKRTNSGRSFGRRGLRVM